MTILPLSYLGSIEHYAHIIQNECIIDTHENFVKRSERNRTTILSANGVMDLTVPVTNSNRPRTPMCDMAIDYSKRWQHQHWISIVSAYNSSPYFEHYMDYFEQFYNREYTNLVDYNIQLLKLTLKLIGKGDHLPTISEQYVEPTEGDIDLRPKKRDSAFCAEPYFQVFSDRMAFAPNLSILDLLFAEGPNSVSVLKRCQL